MSVCLAATCHDPAGSFVDGIGEARAVLAALFDSLAVNATAETSPATLDALNAVGTSVEQRTHGAGTVGIGTARRDALVLALDTDATHIVYSDVDHVLRWATSDPEELTGAVTPDAADDMRVIGRSVEAFAREPRRLQETEGVVNHAVGLLLGPSVVGDQAWDFMIAMRLMTRECARLIVEQSAEESIANDVAWPLLVHSHGLKIGYMGVHGLAYRFRDDFGTAADTREATPSSGSDDSKSLPYTPSPCDRSCRPSRPISLPEGAGAG